ncbi:xanthine dehydrogenase family protein molybdopterin-binding subunit [Acidiphilium sp. PA]|uniref:xanthine dehydrogenase family protein molybdopterin-binding subunit n=1 Tax=Acidiphilium sp. PA TaxID=2871705 RepID=UPI0022444E70|nr:xanthine dehydrogenase family protein molybdopterin-binding subunit [Acidiphilium sp. PA]MCW8306745.1 xanthine dehydrogenase family protein molybdopterin-binding subunit [Acidiphilium sp. PA]
MKFSDPTRPDAQIGLARARPQARALAQGRGTFTSDITLPRMVHAAFLRSPYAHATITAIDLAPARTMPGVVAVLDGAAMADLCTPWVGVLTHLKGLKSAPQYPLAVGRVRWQGEPVAMVLATTRAQAEDAAEHIMVSYDPLPPVVDAAAALAPGAPLIHPELGDNLAFERHIDTGNTDAAFAAADHIIEADFTFARHTGVPLEPRAVLADWNEGAQRLTIHQGTQVPHMMQTIYARHLGLDESQIRVISPDVGGSFGIKIHVYPDEMAVVAASRLLRRPVRFVADRLESFVSDIHARDHTVHARLAIMNDGTITGFDIDDLTGIGPYSAYPRTSAVEANQVINLIGGPYRFAHYRARARVAFQTKAMMSQYRAVGHPIATSVTEGLIDRAASHLGIDPVTIRRRNLIPDDAYPCTSPSGMRFEALSHHACLDRLLTLMDYDALRAEQASLRQRGIMRGIGIASFIEITNPGAAFYGVGGARISAQDGATLRLDAAGRLIVQASVTEQGQGTTTILAQIAAEAMGVAFDHVRVMLGDTDVTPYGGGTWASRAAGIGGEATWQAARALCAQILTLAASILQETSGNLDISGGAVIDRASRAERITLAELARIAYFRPDTLPKGIQAELIATRHYVPREYPFAFTNGIQAAWLELDTETGFITLLKHWVVEDCGTVINPMLVDEQIRGGVVQGIGAALFEQCDYDAEGQMLNASMADYLVPMAGEMPDITIAHITTPTAESTIGAKGAGEAGTAAASAAIANAVNDALSPLAISLATIPLTPARILAALQTGTGRAGGRP